MTTAAAAIDALKSRHPRWQSTSAHAAELSANPATKALGDVLARPEFAAMTSDYASYSRAATERQTAHKRNARRAASFGFAAAVTAGFRLYLGATPSSGTGGALLAVVYVIFILIALSGASYVTLFKPYRRWIDQRSSAERLRIRYFHDLLNAEEPGGGNSPGLTAAKLEFVRAFLMKDQRDWFAGKARTAAKEVKQGQRWKIAALTLVLLAGLPIAISILSEPRIAAMLPQSTNSVISWFAGIGTSFGLDAKILVFAGVLGGALQTWLTSLSATSLADRNAPVYARMVETLDELARVKFEAARAGAARGDMRPVEDFWRELSFALMAEQEGWSDALQTAQLLTLDRLNPASTAAE